MRDFDRHAQAPEASESSADPRLFVAPDPRCLRGFVYLDGEKLDYVIAAHVGPGGWVKVLKKDEAGIFMHVQGELIFELRHGWVRIVGDDGTIYGEAEL